MVAAVANDLGVTRRLVLLDVGFSDPCIPTATD